MTPPSAPGLHPRTRIGKYELLARLSVGGMAELFLARVAGPGRFRKFVTLKLILPDLKEDPAFVRMFLDEARITASLSHSNIGQVFDLGVDAGAPFLAMEFIPGRDLRRLRMAMMQRGHVLPVGFSARVIRDVCLALHYAHHFVDAAGVSCPIVHRDVSPGNVMVSYAGNVKMIDFGVARAKGSLSHTRTGTVRGSRGYMSPEQVNAQELDGRSDLFAAGALLHEMLSGTPLFYADNDMQVFQRLLSAPIEPPSARNADVPPALDAVVLKALERDRSARYASGRAMARAIEQAVGTDALFDEGAVAGLMRELFSEHIERTQALFDLHSAGSDDSLRDLAVKLDDPLPVIDPPSDASADTRTAPTLPAAPSAAATVHGASVLAVDDSVIAREMIRALLESEGFTVHSAPSAAAAIELLEKERPDLVLLDVMMPEMDGFELCRRIRERTPGKQLPILFISSACSLDERLRGLTVGGDDFIRKPYEPEELTGRVRAHLQRVAFLSGLSRA